VQPNTRPLHIYLPHRGSIAFRSGAIVSSFGQRGPMRQIHGVYGREVLKAVR